MTITTHINIVGFRIEKITAREVLGRIERFVAEKTPRTIVLLNPYLILEANKHPEYAEYVRNADLVTADGYGLLLSAKLLGDSFPERVTGTDLMPMLGKLCQEKKYRMYFLGGEPGIAEKAKSTYEAEFPGILIVGARNGYFNETEEKEIVEDIKRKNTDILMVCLGAYKQEMFIKKHLRELNVPVSFGNGAALDFISKKVKRAPKWMQDNGLEWFFRLMNEPKRLAKRYLIGNFIFMWLVFRQLIINKRGGTNG